MENGQSPCLNCVRVKDPKNCENKQCRQWSNWFVKRWQGIYDFYKKYSKEKTV